MFSLVINSFNSIFIFYFKTKPFWPLEIIWDFYFFSKEEGRFLKSKVSHNIFKTSCSNLINHISKLKLAFPLSKEISLVHYKKMLFLKYQLKETFISFWDTRYQNEIKEFKKRATFFLCWQKRNCLHTTWLQNPIFKISLKSRRHIKLTYFRLTFLSWPKNKSC